MRKSGKRQCAAGILVLVAALMAPAVAQATGKINIRVVPAGPDAAIRAELLPPSGGAQVVESGGPAVSIDPEGLPGRYTLTVTVGEVSSRTELDVPPNGALDVTLDVSTDPPTFTVRRTGAIESITVTAQRVEQSMQLVPVAVTALTAQDLEEQHITSVKDLAVATPNLWMEPNTSTNSGSRAAIRGVGEDESMFTSDTPVGIYVDDVYIPRQTGAMFDLYDVERIEVLRGPQGTLYGRNTSAGAIKLITRAPSEELALNFNTEVGNYSHLGLRGSVGAPVSDTFRIQVAAMLQQHDGYDKNLYNGKDVNDQDIWGVRATLEFLPSDSVDIRISGDRLTDRSSPGFPLGFVPQPPVINGFGAGEPSFDHQIDGDTDPHTLLSDLENPANDVDQSGVFASVTWQASDNLMLKSITSWRELDNLLRIDGDGQVGNHFLPPVIPTFLPLFHILQDQEQDQLSQELQLAGTIGEDVDYVGGVYYFHEENQQITENAVLAPFGANRYTDTQLETDSYAAYGSFDLHMWERLTLTIGGRYTRDTKDFGLVVFNPDGSPMYACVAPDGTIVSSTAPCAPDAPSGSVNTPVEKFLKETWSRFTPRLALSWAARDNVLAYLDISTGFKSGAFDGRANEGTTVLPLEPVPPEDIIAYEAGVKSDLLGGLWRLNVAAFFTDFQDLQGTGTDPDGNFTRFSLGDVETKGLEIESIAMPTPGLELTLNLGLLDTEFTSVNFCQTDECGAYGTGDKDLELKYSPKVSYRVGFRYTTDKAMAGGYWSIGSSYSYKAKHYLGFCNAGAQTQGAYGLVDGIIGYDTVNGRWHVALTGSNLTDEDYIIGVFAIPGLRLVSGYINPPRTYSAVLGYRF